MTDRDRGYNRFLRILKPELDINAVHKTRAFSSENLMVFAYYMKIRSFELGEMIAKNMARTARRQLGRATSAIWRTNNNNPKRELSKMNLTSMKVSMF